MFRDHSGAPCSGGGEDVLVDVYTSDGRTVPAEVRQLAGSSSYHGSATSSSSHAPVSRYNSQNVSIFFNLTCIVIMIHAQNYRFCFSLSIMSVCFVVFYAPFVFLINNSRHV